MVEQFRRGLVFKAHRLLYRSTLGSRVTKKKKNYHGGHDDDAEEARGVPEEDHTHQDQVDDRRPCPHSR